MIIFRNYLWTFLNILLALHLRHALCQHEENVKIKVETTPYTIKVILEESEDNYHLENVTCINGKNSEIIADENFICENLDPCSEYKIITIIKYVHENNQEVFEKTLTESTNYTDPEVHFGPIVASTDHINISWVALDETCISKYIIEVKSAENSWHYEFNSEKETQVKDLNPCLEYNITLEVIDIYKNPFTKLNKTVETEYTEPGDITVIFADEKDGQKKVSWESPEHKSCIKTYVLKWFILNCSEVQKSIFSRLDEITTLPEINEGNCAWIRSFSDPTLVEYTITDLQGCETYGFEILINENSTPKAEEQFRSLGQVPSKIEDQELNVGETEVIITWSPPKNHSKCIKNYIVSITGPSQDESKTIEKSTSNIFETFDNLSPCGEYISSISFATQSGEKGPESNSSFIMKEGKPTAVKTLQVDTRANELEIFWSAPDFAHLCVAEYHVTAWADEYVQKFSTTTNETRITFEGLPSCQPYTVQIIPTTTTKNDGDPKQIETSTSPLVAKPPKSFIVVGLYPNRLEVSAHDLDNNNNCETISAKFNCSTDSEDPSIRYKSAEQYVYDGQLGGISFQALLSPLSPFVSYKCEVFLFNVAGWSESKPLLQKTEPYFPERPDGIKLQSSTSSSLTFTWDIPTRTNGVINLYKCFFQMYEPDYFVPPSCKYSVTKPEPRETSDLSQSFAKLEPFTKYSFQVAAQNQYGIGEYTRPLIVTTKPSVSDKVMELKSTSYGPYLSDTEYKASVLVSFMAPCKSNGIIQYVQIEFVGDRTNFSREQFYRQIQPNFDENGYMEYNETQLKPEYNYTVSVEIKTDGVDEWSSAVRSTFDAPAGIPKVPNDVLKEAKVNPFDTNNPTRTAVVRFPRSILESESGNIIYMALLISQKECDPSPQLRFGAINSIEEWPEIPSWNIVYQNNGNKCIQQYQTTPSHWVPDSSNNIKISWDARLTSKDDEIVYIIGVEDCSNAKDKYCNGPLQPDTEYNLVFRLFTKSGYRDSYIIVFKTDSLIQVSLILFSICGCLLLAFVAGIIYLWVTKRIQWKRQSYHDVGDSFGDTIPKNFATYYHDITRPEKIAREFKELSGVAMDLSYSASEMGSAKNRYADIFPYDKNRVILDIDAEGSDYINASFIDGYNRKKEYIATQGPKPESTLDFWRMILQYNVRVIVMVTQFKEDNIIKCHTYFPFNAKGIIVSIKKAETFELYDRTEMNVTHDKYGLKQKVVHYFFKKWPDRGVPSDPNHLINFLKKVKGEKVPRYSPIVVHCSAGVGRTGTIIGLDVIMQRLKNESKINIYETVKKLRFQRMKMVQTLAQYSFLYSCTYELVKHKKQNHSIHNKSKNGKSVSFQDMVELKEDSSTVETSNKISNTHAELNYETSQNMDVNKPQMI